jgi:hypothetical protein
MRQVYLRRVAPHGSSVARPRFLRPSVSGGDASARACATANQRRVTSTDGVSDPGRLSASVTTFVVVGSSSPPRLSGGRLRGLPHSLGTDRHGEQQPGEAGYPLPPRRLGTTPTCLAPSGGRAPPRPGYQHRPSAKAVGRRLSPSGLCLRSSQRCPQPNSLATTA